MEISIKVKGYEKLVDCIKTLATKNRPKLKQILEKSLFILENDAKKNVSVDTGRLRSSITSKIVESKEGLAGMVGTNLNYAIAQEQGTKPHLAFVGKWAERHGFRSGTRFLFVSGKAHPFMKPSFENNFSRINKMFEAGINNLVKIGG